MSKFAKDTRVMRDFARLQRSWQIECGVTLTDPVIDPLNGQEKVYVKWDRGYNPHPMEVYTAHLITEEEGKAKNSKFEEEYNKLEAEIRVKIDAATDAIDEAQKLAASIGMDLYGIDYANQALEGSMDAAGWNTSSWSC